VRSTATTTYLLPLRYRTTLYYHLRHDTRGTVLPFILHFHYRSVLPRWYHLDAFRWCLDYLFLILPLFIWPGWDITTDYLLCSDDGISLRSFHVPYILMLTIYDTAYHSARSIPHSYCSSILQISWTPYFTPPAFNRSLFFHYIPSLLTFLRYRCTFFCCSTDSILVFVLFGRSILFNFTLRHHYLFLTYRTCVRDTYRLHYLTPGCVWIRWPFRLGDTVSTCHSGWLPFWYLRNTGVIRRVLHSLFHYICSIPFRFHSHLFILLGLPFVHFYHSFSTIPILYIRLYHCSFSTGILPFCSFLPFWTFGGYHSFCCLQPGYTIVGSVLHSTTGGDLIHSGIDTISTFDTVTTTILPFHWDFYHSFTTVSGGRYIDHFLYLVALPFITYDLPLVYHHHHSTTWDAVLFIPFLPFYFGIHFISDFVIPFRYHYLLRYDTNFHSPPFPFSLPFDHSTTTDISVPTDITVFLRYSIPFGIHCSWVTTIPYLLTYRFVLHFVPPPAFCSTFSTYHRAHCSTVRYISFHHFYIILFDTHRTPLHWCSTFVHSFRLVPVTYLRLRHLPVTGRCCSDTFVQYHFHNLLHRHRVHVCDAYVAFTRSSLRELFYRFMHSFLPLRFDSREWCSFLPFSCVHFLHLFHSPPFCWIPSTFLPFYLFIFCCISTLHLMHHRTCSPPPRSLPYDTLRLPPPFHFCSYRRTGITVSTTPTFTYVFYGDFLLYIRYYTVTVLRFILIRLFYFDTFVCSIRITLICLYIVRWYDYILPQVPLQGICSCSVVLHSDYLFVLIPRCSTVHVPTFL